jgi:type IV secretory pathway VirB10-like protein
MTVAAPELAPLGTEPPAPMDPHAAKLAPDDPRLRLGRPAPRTLRTGPLVAVGAGLLCTLLFAVAFALQPPRTPAKERTDPSATPPPPVVPENIRNAASRPASARPDSGASPNELRAGARTSAPSPEETKRHLAEEQELRAQNAGVLFDTRESEVPTAPEPMHAAPTASAAGPSTEAADGDPNLQDRKNAFVDGLGAKTADYLPAGIQHPRSPYEVKAGTIIPAALVTGINSDLPGPVIGQVREHVYDTVTGNYLLIPQGSRLLAHYDSMVSWGQERVLVCWNRLVFPNGDSINLHCMPAADLQGAAGLTDEVDEHWMRILKGATVASLLAATATAVAGNTEGYNPTVPQVWARNAAGEVNQIGQQITSRNLRIQPTITVRPGFSVNVVVTKDMVLPRYAEPPVAGATP